MSEYSYWMRRMISRRAALRGAAAGGGLVALSLAGCGGDDDDSDGAAPGPSTSGAGGATKTDTVVDIYKGQRGGKLTFQAYADWGGTVLVKANNFGIHQGGSFVHSSLYQQRGGRPGVDRSFTGIELDLATAMPEQLPDQLTYVVKMRKDAKFQNGRALTTEDVKYSYDRYAFAADSGMKSQWPFLDKVEVVDAETVRFTTKTPFADMLGTFANYTNGAFILAKEFEESSEATTKWMGAGAYIMTDRQAPVLNARYKRNPDYYVKEWPYFDEIEVLGTSDTSKKIADFISKQTHVMYWLFEDDAEQVKKGRPDAVHFVNTFPGYSAQPRVDLPPFNDKRIRQALSMAIDRKQMNEATQRNRAENDQWFSWVIKGQGFRKPGELPGAKYWNYDLQAAKQLVGASGIQTPFDIQMHSWDATVIGQGVVDQATLVATQWRNAGFANVKATQLTFPQTAGTTFVGNYEGFYYGPGGGGNFGFYPALSLRLVNWSPPEGVKAPTTNRLHINNPTLSDLVDKQSRQLNQEERKQTFKAMEELFSEEQYAIVTITVNNNWFVDPALRNMQVPLFMPNGNVHYVKYWWFDGGKNP